MVSRQFSTKKTGSGTLLLPLFLLLMIVLAACSNGTTSAPGVHKHKDSLTLVANQGGDLVRNFNPFSGNVITGTQGFIYETLLFFNRGDGSVHPWLAQSSEFSQDATQLTFHLRTDVTWSDGQPFTSDDVVFTLGMLAKYPDVDLNSISGYIKNVSAPDKYTVRVTLTNSYSPMLWYLGGQMWVVSRHEWSTVQGDPAQFADPNPIGTGPYVVGSFTPQLMTLNKNPRFWQPGKPAVNQLRFPAFSSNTSSELVLNTGGIDWNGQYTPNIEKTYISRDKEHNHYWFPVSDIVFLMPNLTKAPFNNVDVRRAISAAINRDRIYRVAESGYEPVASPTGLVLPASQSYLDPQYANLKFSVDTSKADTLLQGAGYTRGSDGIYADKNGKKLSFSLQVPDGYTDWITTCQFIATDLKAVGMDVTVSTVAYNTFYSNMQNGTFDMTIWGTTPGPSPFYIYDELLLSANAAPVGQQATSNFERWIDTTNTDNLLNQFAGTNDPAMQKQAMSGLEKIMVEQLPSIPLMNEPYWYEYNTTYWVGWPDAQHPYAEPSPFTSPDNEQVVLHLQPS